MSRTSWCWGGRSLVEFAPGSFRRCLVFAVVLSQAVGAPLARAQSPARPPQVSPSNESSPDAARRDIAIALGKYEAGEYRQAAELFSQAYQVVPDANLLYNAARCYERLGEPRKAIVRYQQFMQAPDSDEHGRARANAALERLEQAEFLVMRKSPSDQATERAEPGPVEPESRGSAASGLPWYLLGVGTVALGAGAWSMYSAWELERKITDAPAYHDANAVHPLTYTEARSVLESRQRRLEWGALGLGLGGALVATSVVWWLLEARQSEPTPHTGPSVQLGPSGVSATWGGRF